MLLTVNTAGAASDAGSVPATVAPPVQLTLIVTDAALLGMKSLFTVNVPEPGGGAAFTVTVSVQSLLVSAVPPAFASGMIVPGSALQAPPPRGLTYAAATLAVAVNCTSNCEFASMLVAAPEI